MSVGHRPILESRHVRWPDEGACAASAHALAQQPGVASALIELRGGLGAGKTTFARHLLHGLGVSGRIKSPSYAIVEEHELPNATAWHFDFYRFDDPEEWDDLGFRDLFAAPGLKLVEWPEKAQGLLPVCDLDIAITVNTDESRTVLFKAFTESGCALLLP